MRPGIPHAFLKVQQDLIGDIDSWSGRTTPIFAQLNAKPGLHDYRIFPSRTGPYPT